MLQDTATLTGGKAITEDLGIKPDHQEGLRRSAKVHRTNRELSVKRSANEGGPVRSPSVLGRSGLRRQPALVPVGPARRMSTHLPELFGGLSRVPRHGPIRYPLACPPQAWAAGVALHLVRGMLGFQADAAANRLTLDNPSLSSWPAGQESAVVELLARDGAAEVVVRR